MYQQQLTQPTQPTQEQQQQTTTDTPSIKKTLTLPPITPLHHRKFLTHEEVIFHNDNEARNKAFQNYMKDQMNAIDQRAENYMAYMYTHKKPNQKSGNVLTEQSSLPNQSMNIAPSSKYYKLLNNGDTPSYKIKSPFNQYNKFVPLYVKSKQSDITNPNYFSINNYSNLQAKRREYLQYNYINSERNFVNKHSYQYAKQPLSYEDKKAESLNINPYNSNHRNVYSLGKSELVHNPILNPVPNFMYNRYLNNIYSKQQQ